MAGDSVQTVSYGIGQGGKPFPRTSFTEIGFRGGKYVDCILLDGVPHGTDKGTASNPAGISFAPDEYITKWTIHAGAVVDFLHFTTNKERTIGTGDGSKGNRSVVTDVRLLTIGGSAEGPWDGYLVVDRLDLTYVANYKASEIVESDARFIIRFVPQGIDLEQYEKSTENTVYAYTQVTSHMENQEYSASVEGEYYAKVTAATKLSIQDTETKTIHHELQQTLEHSEKTTVHVSEGHVGCAIVNGTIMQGAKGNNQCWMFPTGAVQFVVVNMDDLDLLLNTYDLTGLLDAQVKGLKKHRTHRNGYVYYSADPARPAVGVDAK